MDLYLHREIHTWRYPTRGNKRPSRVGKFTHAQQRKLPASCIVVGRFSGQCTIGDATIRGACHIEICLFLTPNALSASARLRKTHNLTNTHATFAHEPSAELMSLDDMRATVLAEVTSPCLMPNVVGDCEPVMRAHVPSYPATPKLRVEGAPRATSPVHINGSAMIHHTGFMG